MLRRIPWPIAILLALAVWAGTFLLLGEYAIGSDGGSEQVSRPVMLGEAKVPPERVFYLYPGTTHYLTTRQCGRPDTFYVETSAYRWNGGPLEGQRWNGLHDRTYWPDTFGGRVTFDGVRVYNGTQSPVLFAGWC